MKLNGWQHLWVLVSILSIPGVVVGGVRVLEWPSAPPVTPEMAILQVRGTRQAFLGPTDPYDFARAMGVGERADAKILRDEFFLGPNFSALDGAPADHDSRAIEERLADWLIDARDVLSVQVHPDDHFARVLEHQAHGKTECWFIVDAAPGSDLIYGFTRDGVAKEMIGHEGVRFAPYLTSLFCFILVTNVFGLIPVIQFSPNAHIAFSKASSPRRSRSACRRRTPLPEAI